MYLETSVVSLESGGVSEDVPGVVDLNRRYHQLNDDKHPDWRHKVLKNNYQIPSPQFKQKFHLNT